MRFFLALLLVSFAQLSFAQLTTDEISKIDDLFKSWKQPNHPGGSVGIMKNGELVYSKAFGLASLDYQIPNETSTLYNAASVSKQFTALGIVLLSLQGKIDIDANINTYLPTMPQFKYPITTRQMLHHTSGLRSLHAVLGLAGWREVDLRTNEDLYRYMEKQVDLNFKPNDEYLYCNTGYMFMAKIIENVTGEKFTTWIKNNVFNPLGMKETYVEDHLKRVVPNNATSYDATKGSYDRATEFWGYVGSGNMHTSTADMLTYLSNYSHPKEGWEEAFKMMQTLDNFNNGTPNKYAFGINIDSLNGHRRIQHGGSIGGFRAQATAYPNADVHIAILTNFSNSNPGKISNEITDILLPAKKESITKVSKKSKLTKIYKIKAEALSSFEGHYWSSKNFIGTTLKVLQDTLSVLNDSGKTLKLLPVSASIFKTNNDNLYSFNQIDNKALELTFTTFKKDTIVFQKYNNTPPTISDLEEYVGRFYSDELETFYDIYLKAETLYSHHPRHGDFKIEWIKKDVLKGEYPFSFIEIERDNQNKIKGLKVTNGRVVNAWFKKINLP